LISFGTPIFIDNSGVVFRGQIIRSGYDGQHPENCDYLRFWRKNGRIEREFLDSRKKVPSYETRPI
jgi:hypothetical protein